MATFETYFVADKATHHDQESVLLPHPHCRFLPPAVPRSSGSTRSAASSSTATFRSSWRRAKIGQKEQPGGDHRRRVLWAYGGDGVPWCSAPAASSWRSCPPLRGPTEEAVTRRRYHPKGSRRSHLPAAARSPTPRPATPSAIGSPPWGLLAAPTATTSCTKSPVTRVKGLWVDFLRGGSYPDPCGAWYNRACAARSCVSPPLFLPFAAWQ